MKYTANHESSMIQSSTYDTNTLELIVTFHGGNSYTYNGVSESDYNSLVNAESVGKSFNELIRAKYAGQKLLTEVNGDNLKTDNNENLLLG